MGATNLTFRYTAASLTGAIRLEVPTGGVTRVGGVTNTTNNGKIGWTVPDKDSADSPTDPAGEVSASAGTTIDVGNTYTDAGVDYTPIVVTGLELIAGQTVDIYYIRASYAYSGANVAGASTFRSYSSGSATKSVGTSAAGWTVLSGSPVLYVLSADGVGKVHTSQALEIDQDLDDGVSDTADNLTLTATAADPLSNQLLTFRYNLSGAGRVDTNGNNVVDLGDTFPATPSLLGHEYIKDGQLQIVVPTSGAWDAPIAMDDDASGVPDEAGEVSVKMLDSLTERSAAAGIDITATLKISDTEDYRPTVTFPSGQILVAIPKMYTDALSATNSQVLEVKFYTKVPAGKANYPFLIRATSGASGGLQLLNLNRAANSAGYFTTDSQVVLSTDYGVAAQGTTSTNLPATVAGGAAALSYTFTYTATVDIDGDLADNALTLRIPTAWTAPVAHQDSTVVTTDTTATDTAGLVSVSDPATEHSTTGAKRTLEMPMGRRYFMMER